MAEKKVQIALKKGYRSEDLTRKQMDILEYINIHGRYDELIDADSLSGILGCHHSTAKQHLEGLEKIIRNAKIEKIEKGRGSDISIKINKIRGVSKDYYLKFESKGEKVKGMVISEFPLDSVIGDSKQSREARIGIVKYVTEEKPDVIFVDGLVSRIRYPEIYIPGVIESDPLRNFMQKPFELASAFLSELHIASPYSQIYVTMSDADESNIRRLTKYNALKRIESTEEKIREYRDELKILKGERRLTKKAKENTKNIDSRLEKKEKKIFGLRKQLFMPSEESMEYQQIKQEISRKYVQTLKEENPRIHFNLSDINTKIRGYSFSYSHNYNSKSGAVLSSRFNRLEGLLRKLLMSRRKVPDFFVESGHHGEAVAKPFRHALEDKYSFVVSSPVMEDQKIIQGIIEGEFMPETFQGKQNKIEACKRTNIKSLPTPGITVFGRDEYGYWCFNHSLKLLSEVGKGEIKPEKMNYETLLMLSDIHIGKGAVKYNALKTALGLISDRIDEAVKQKRSSPILNVTNESLQGLNYDTMPVETKRSMPEEFKEELRGLAKRGANIEEIIDTAINELDRTNEPRIMNQLDRYYYLTNEVILKLLINSKYNPAAIFNESTHIRNSVGEKGITETGLQTIGYKVLEDSLRLLEKWGELKSNPKFKEIYKKIKLCEVGLEGYGKFPIKVGENNYIFSTTHKAVSAGPSSNIPAKQIRKAINMADDADVFLSAHHHIPYFFTIGRQESNEITAFYKGATFNEYDSYGMMGGWTPAVIGYVEAYIPLNKGKGSYGVRFVTSDVLKRVQEENKAKSTAKK